MTLDKHSFAGATIDLSAPTLTLRTGGARVAWKEVKYIGHDPVEHSSAVGNRVPVCARFESLVVSRPC
jgi:hypothetical protein